MRLQNYFVPIAVPYSSYAFRKSWIYVLSWDGEREKKNFRLNVSCTRFLFYLGAIHILRKALVYCGFWLFAVLLHLCLLSRGTGLSLKMCLSQSYKWNLSLQKTYPLGLNSQKKDMNVDYILNFAIEFQGVSNFMFCSLSFIKGQIISEQKCGVVNFPKM